MQFLGLASVVALVGVAGLGAASTLRKQADVTATSEGNVALETGAPKVQAPVPRLAAPAVVLQAEPPAPVDSTPVSTPARSASRGGFVLVDGRTQLTDSIYATRTGDSVIVNFDAFGYRTRRSDKIENTLRLTMPMVFGRMATASFDTLTAGQLVTNHDVIGSLASQGMSLTLDNGAVVHLRMLTRVGRDGPLAVGYLATITR